MNGETLFCSVGVAAIRVEPDARSERVTDLLFGEKFISQSAEGGFVRGRREFDKVEGFVGGAELGSTKVDPSHRVNQLFIHVYRASDLRVSTGLILPMNALVDLTGATATSSSGQVRVELHGGGWVPAGALVPIDRIENDIRATAVRWVGSPYLHGGRTPLGCDGPGFVQTILAMFGHRVPRRKQDQLEFFSDWAQSPKGHGEEFTVAYSGDSAGFSVGNEDVIAAFLPQMQIAKISCETYWQHAYQNGLSPMTFLCR